MKIRNVLFLGILIAVLLSAALPALAQSLSIRQEQVMQGDDGYQRVGSIRHYDTSSGTSAGLDALLYRLGSGPVGGSYCDCAESSTIRRYDSYRSSSRIRQSRTYRNNSRAGYGSMWSYYPPQGSYYGTVDRNWSPFTAPLNGSYQYQRSRSNGSWRQNQNTNRSRHRRFRH